MFDYLLVTNAVNVKYLTGFDGSFGWVVFGVNGEVEGEIFLITDARYKGYVEGVVKDGVEICDLTRRPMENLVGFLGKKNVRGVGFEAGDLTIGKLREFEKEVEEVEFVESFGVVEKMRLKKTPQEIDTLAKSQSVCGEIFLKVRSDLKVGMTEREIAWKINELANKFGADGLSFDSIVAINDHSACPHHHNTDRKLANGDLVLVDMGVVWDGYCSDMTRMIFTGDPTDKQEQVYKIVLEAQEKALNEMRDGMSCVEADGLARGVIEEKGFGDKFMHSLGHGVGLEIHEKPALSPRGKGVLERGMVVTVEPGIYLEDEFGVRIEDLVCLDGEGVRNLTDVSKEIEVVKIN